MDFGCRLVPVRLRPVALLAFVAGDELQGRGHIAHGEDVLAALRAVAVGVFDRFCVHYALAFDEFGEAGRGLHTPLYHAVVGHTGTQCVGRLKLPL